MKVKKLPYYGFNHEQVNQHFEGDLTFINEFCVKGNDRPVAVYRAENPNAAKGHKRYLLLYTQHDAFEGRDQLWVSGMTEEEMEEERYQAAIHCLKCDEVIFSMARHDYHSCSCGDVFIDGGKAYTRAGFKEDAKFKYVTLDLLTDTIKEEKNNEQGASKSSK